jgi:hypothetical protein
LADGVSKRFGAVPGQRRSIIYTSNLAVTLHARQLQQHRKPRGPLDQRPDRRTSQAKDQIALCRFLGPVRCAERIEYVE